MSTVLTVEVAGKFGPKAGGSWYGVKKPLKASEFEAGKSYEVELEEWKEGRFNIIKAKEVSSGSSEVVKKTAGKQQNTVAKVQADRDEGMKEGNRRNVAAIVTQGLVIAHGLDVDKAYETYIDIHGRLVEADK